jgi:hypothetical protein
VPQVKTAVAPASGLSRPSIYDLSGLVHPRRLAPPSGCLCVWWGGTGGGRCARPPGQFCHPDRGGRAEIWWSSRGAGGQRAAKDRVVPDGGRWKPASLGLRRWGGRVPRVAAVRRTLGTQRLSVPDMAGTWNRLVRLFVNMARINGITSCQRGGSKRWGRQVHSLQRVNLDAQTWRFVATGGLGDRRMSLQDMAGTGSATWNGSWDAARPHGPCVRGEGGLWLDREPRVATRPHPPRADR